MNGQGQGAETIPFSVAVKAQGNIEDWLCDLLFKMQVCSAKGKSGISKENGDCVEGRMFGKYECFLCPSQIRTPYCAVQAQDSGN